MRHQLIFSLVLVAGFVAPARADEETPAGKKDESKAERGADPAPEILIIGIRKSEGVPVIPLDNVGSRDVFGPEQVRETGARDLNDLVLNIPAISTRPYNGGEAAAPSFSMRGLPDDGLTEYVNVLIDGVPASPLPYGWTAFSFLPLTPERIYAVDYIRGGHSVRYSPNTVGGILNFVTQPIPVDRTINIRTTFGNFDYTSALLSAGWTDGPLGAVLTFVDRRGEGYRDDGGFEQRDSNLKIRYDLDEVSWIAGSFSYMESDHQAPGGLTLAQFEKDRFGNARPRQKFSGFRGVADVVWHQDFAENGWVEAFGFLSETGRRLEARRPRFGEPETFLKWTDESWATSVGVRAQHSVELFGMPHTFYGGARYHREWIPSWEIRSEPYGGGASTQTQDDEFSLTTLSLHLDDTFEPFENFTVVLGARIEWVPEAEGSREDGFDWDGDFFDILPGVGASYEICDQAAVFANYHEGFRSPQVWGFAWSTGDDDLEFERGRAYEAGARVRDLAGFDGSVTLWRTEYDDFGVFYTGFYENLGKIESQGIDFVVEWDAGRVIEELDGLEISGSLTLQDAELRAGPNRGNEVPYAWEQKAAWRIRYRFLDGWSASLGGTFVGESFSDEANTKKDSDDGQLGINDARTLWDAQISGRIDLSDNAVLDLAAGATNLFGTEWEVHSRGGFFGGGLAAGAPRQFYVSVGLTLNW